MSGAGHGEDVRLQAPGEEAHQEAEGRVHGPEREADPGEGQQPLRGERPAPVGWSPGSKGASWGARPLPRPTLSSGRRLASCDISATLTGGPTWRWAEGADSNLQTRVPPVLTSQPGAPSGKVCAPLTSHTGWQGATEPTPHHTHTNTSPPNYEALRRRRGHSRQHPDLPSVSSGAPGCLRQANVGLRGFWSGDQPGTAQSRPGRLGPRP